MGVQPVYWKRGCEKMIKSPNIVLQLAGLISGTGIAASIQLALVPPVISFDSYLITIYFLAGLISGYIRPMLSWRWGIWLVVPWIGWVFFNMASAGFRGGIAPNILLLLLQYSFPFLPACLGAFAGARTSLWKRELNS